MTVGAVALGVLVPTAVAATPASATVLAQGVGLGTSPSPAVRGVQRILHRRGYSLGRPGVDGRFGPLTAAAVRRMQRRYGLVSDGIVGPKTRSVLDLIAETLAARTRTKSRRSSPPRQPTSRPPAQTAPSRTTQPSPAPATQPAGRTVASSAGGKSDARLATIVAALAALISLVALAIALVRARRQDRRLQVTPIERELFLEGESRRPGVGAFRGLALATAVPPRGEDDPRRARYLVNDPLKPAPVWVEGGDVRRAPSKLAAGERVIGYVTADPDPAVEHQAFIAIETACERAGWKLEDIVRDQDTGPLVGRPGLLSALERIAAREARGLVVSDVSRLAPSLRALTALIEWFRDAEAVLVLLDLDLDTATDHGHHTASALVRVCSWESKLMTTRSRRRLARVPDPTEVPTAEDRAAVIERIRAMQEAGMSLHAIAIQCTNEGVPPPPGAARWTTTAVKNTLAALPAAEHDLRNALPRVPHRRR